MIELLKKYAKLTDGKFTYILDQWGRGEVIEMNCGQSFFHSELIKAGLQISDIKKYVQAIAKARRKPLFGIFFHST